MTEEEYLKNLSIIFRRGGKTELLIEQLKQINQHPPKFFTDGANKLIEEGKMKSDIDIFNQVIENLRKEKKVISKVSF